MICQIAGGSVRHIAATLGKLIALQAPVEDFRWIMDLAVADKVNNRCHGY